MSCEFDPFLLDDGKRPDRSVMAMQSDKWESLKEIIDLLLPETIREIIFKRKRDWENYSSTEGRMSGELSSDLFPEE